jgi:hypothetical protein
MQEEESTYLGLVFDKAEKKNGVTVAILGHFRLLQGESRA